jgi:uncharacterized phage infection (PIP) family protein YhgE
MPAPTAMQMLVDDAMRGLDVVAEGTNGLTAAVDAVKADLEKVQASAGSTVKPQVQAVKDAIAAAEAGLQNLGDGGATEVKAALTDLSTATTTLLTSLEDGPADRPARLAFLNCE